MLKWVFGADTGPFRRGLNEMRNETKQFAGSIKGMIAGAIGFGAIKAGFQGLFVEMDRVQKLGQRFGETAETIQKIALAADLAGVDLEMLAKGITKVTQNAADAAKGSATMAAAFNEAGIDAAAFVNLPMEEKVLALAGAFEKGKASGEMLDLMVKLLGKSGADMIPFLKQGQQELQEQFANTATASQSTVDAIAGFNDAITSLKQKAQVAGASIIQFFQYGFGTIGAVIDLGIRNGMIGLDTLIGGARDAGNFITRTLSGDLSGAGEAASSFGNRFKDAMREAKANADQLGETINGIYNEVYNSSGSGGGPSKDFEDTVAKAEELAKVEEDRKKLALEVAKLEEEARQRQLSLAEKILEAEQKRAELAKKITDPFNTPTETLEAQKEKLEIEKELEALRKSSADATAQDAAKRTEAANELAALGAKEAALDRDIKFNGLDDEGKLAMLKGEQADLEGRSTNPLISDKRQAEARIGAKEKQGEIDALGNKLLGDVKTRLAENESNGPVIAASSLAEAGGGGPVAMFGNETREQRKVELLAEMASYLAMISGKGGETDVIPPSA